MSVAEVLVVVSLPKLVNNIRVIEKCVILVYFESLKAAEMPEFCLHNSQSDF